MPKWLLTSLFAGMRAVYSALIEAFVCWGLCELPENKGGSYVIKKYPEEADVIFAESEAELWDMDTKEDYDRMCNYEL